MNKVGFGEDVMSREVILAAQEEEDRADRRYRAYLARQESATSTPTPKTPIENH